MLNNKTIAVVIPCYNEESQIGMVIETMPDFVDRLIIVDDSSTDNTIKVAEKYLSIPRFNSSSIKLNKKKIKPNLYNKADILIQEKNEEELKYFLPSKIINEKSLNDRIILIKNIKNGGVGAAIARGYKWAKDYNIDCTAVMAGDGQMDPDELKKICSPIVENNVDYVKGNRLIHQSAKYLMPKRRFLGNSILSIMTKVASGYWRVSDTQTGFTAISLSALNLIDLYKIYKTYGMPNDMLVKLNIINATIREVPIKPVYNVGEKSKMKIMSVIPRISFLLITNFIKRLLLKYFVRDFHPLFLLYNLGILLFLAFGIYASKVISLVIEGNTIHVATLFAFTFLGFFSFQSLVFAMWMDIQDNDRLYK